MTTIQEKLLKLIHSSFRLVGVLLKRLVNAKKTTLQLNCVSCGCHLYDRVVHKEVLCEINAHAALKPANAVICN